MEYLIIYAIIVTFLSLIFFIMVKDAKTSVLVLIISLLFPVGGLILIGYYLYFTFKNQSEDSIFDYSSHEIEKRDYINEVDQELELNVLPASDVLNFEDTNIKRSGFLSLVKNQSSNIGDIIYDALHDKDGETAHYAAAMIQGMKSDFNERYDEYKKIIEEDDGYTRIKCEYLDFLSENIQSGVLDDTVRNSLKNEYITIVTNSLKGNRIKEKHLGNLCRCLLEDKRVDEAAVFSSMYKEKFPESEKQILLQLEILYLQRDIDGFKKLVNEFMESDAINSHEALNKVRFWMQVVN